MVGAVPVVRNEGGVPNGGSVEFKVELVVEGGPDGPRCGPLVAGGGGVSGGPEGR